MNRQIHPKEPTSLQIDAFLALATAASLQPNPPTDAELRTALHDLGEWHAAEPASPERDARAVELATILMQDYPRFQREIQVAFFEEGSLHPSTTRADLGRLAGAITCA
jgi:hypothetical protein